MRTVKTLLAIGIAFGFAFAAIDAAKAQGMQMGPGMMQGGTDRMGHGMMQGGADSPSAGSDMSQCMMRGDMSSGMMGQHERGGMMMGSGMMGSGMMGSGMMQGGTRSGMGALFGSRVRPVMNLSEEDVRAYLALQLERLNTKRLKIGDVKSDEGMITADVVTVDNSLVQRLKVNPHTGAIEYEN